MASFGLMLSTRGMPGCSSASSRCNLSPRAQRSCATRSVHAQSSAVHARSRAVAFLAGCGAKPAPAPSAPPVLISRPLGRQIIDWDEFVGRFEAVREVDVRPRVSGYVQTIAFKDGDIVRKNLSSELGFSKEHRNLNIRRIGFVASEITKNRGVAICAPIAPYRAARREVRELIGGYGGYIEVHVATPLEVCEQRDRKGLYAKARGGLIRNFTGIDDPYEPPDDAEVTVDTSTTSAEAAVEQILGFLGQQGFIGAWDDPGREARSHTLPPYPSPSHKAKGRDPRGTTM